MFLFGVRASAESRAKTHADAVLRFFTRIRNAGVIERHFCLGDGELRVAIEAFQTMRRKMIFRNPIDDLASAMSVELRSVEARDRPDATLLGAQAAPEIFAADPDA